MEEVRKKEAKGERKDRKEGGWWRGKKVRMRNNNGWKAFHWSMKWELGDSFTHSCTKSRTHHLLKKLLLSFLTWWRLPVYVEASEQHSSIRNRRRIWKLEILSDVDHSAPSECCCCSAFLQFSFKFICHLLFSTDTFHLYTCTSFSF